MEEIHYVKNRIHHILENEIDGKTYAFNVKDIERLYDELVKALSIIDSLEEKMNELEKDKEYWEEKAKNYYDLI